MKYLYSILILLIAAPAFAGNFNFSPYAAHYLHNGFNHHNNVVVVRQKTVEIDADVALGLNGYIANIEKVTAHEHQKEELNAKTIRDLVDLVKTLLTNQGGGNNTPMPTNPPEVPATPDEPTTPNENDDLDTKVFKIFKTNCVTCHGESKQSGGFKLVGKDKDGEYLMDLKLPQRVLVWKTTSGIGLDKHNLKRMPLGERRQHAAAPENLSDK